MGGARHDSSADPSASELHTGRPAHLWSSRRRGTVLGSCCSCPQQGFRSREVGPPSLPPCAPGPRGALRWRELRPTAGLAAEDDGCCCLAWQIVDDAAACWPRRARHFACLPPASQAPLPENGLGRLWQHPLPRAPFRGGRCNCSAGVRARANIAALRDGLHVAAASSTPPTASQLLVHLLPVLVLSRRRVASCSPLVLLLLLLLSAPAPLPPTAQQQAGRHGAEQEERKECNRAQADEHLRLLVHHEHHAVVVLPSARLMLESSVAPTAVLCTTMAE